ncbi:MAG: PAS domain S-box protein [Telluria sp.]
MKPTPDAPLQDELVTIHPGAGDCTVSLQRLTLLAEAYERLNACDDRAAILDALRDFARRLVGADGVSIVLRDAEECFYARTDAVQGALWEGQRFPLVSCISGWVMLNRETAVIPDVYADGRIPHDVYRATFVRSLIMVPVGRGDALAAIGAYWSSVRMPGTEEVALLQSLARAAGSALQRCAADERIKASESRLRLAFGSTLVGFCFAAPGGAILEVNERFAAICGYPAEELPGKNVFALTCPEDRERNSRLIEDLLAGRIDGFHLEKRYLHRAGHVVWVRNDVWLIEDPAGGTRQIAAAVIDVTREREAQERLLQTQKLDLLGQLTGGIAHDFNNLLTVISGSAECLAEGLADRPALRELAQVIQRAGDRGAGLTRSLLAFARRQPLEPRLVAPDDTVRAMRALLQRTLGSNIVLDVRPRSGPASALVDVAQFEAALVNLCVNARNAMPSGGTLTITTARVMLAPDAMPASAAGRPFVTIAVADDGAGMTDEVRARAFEPFFTTGQQRGGSGLGLSMVDGFVKGAGGHVTIDSAPGKGCIVTIYLPCAGSAARHAGLPAETASPGSGEHVLLVEDDAAVRSVVMRTLRRLGYEVSATDDPRNALSLIGEGVRCDLLLTDILMPGSMNGVELGRRVQLVRPGLPIVYMTGYADRLMEEVGHSLPSGHLLHKPFRRAELARTIRACLGRSADEAVLDGVAD